MKIGIQCKGFSLTSAIAGQVHKRLQLLLGQGIRRIRRVDIILSELNGPGGSVDKRCLIKVSIDGLLPVVIDDIQSDLYVAIDRAGDRASRTVLRRMALDNSRRRAETQRWLAEQKQRRKQTPVAA